MDWDHLRYIHALAMGGTLAKAGDMLGVHQTTVLRRLDQMERELGVSLFNRTREGLSLTAAGEEAFNVAEKVVPDFEHLERQLVGQDSRPEGKVRLATSDTLLHGLLSPLLAEVSHRYPGIQLETITGNEVLSLSRRDADIAIRPTNDPQETLVGKRIGTIESAIYGATDYLGNAPPRDQLSEHAWVLPDDGLSHVAAARWFYKNVKNTTPAIRCNSLQAIFTLVRSGAGLGIVPCYVGDQAPELERLSGPMQGLGYDLWVLTHPDLRRMARVRVVLDFLYEQLTPFRPIIEGTAPQVSGN